MVFYCLCELYKSFAQRIQYRINIEWIFCELFPRACMNNEYSFYTHSHVDRILIDANKNPIKYKHLFKNNNTTFIFSNTVSSQHSIVAAFYIG